MAEVSVAFGLGMRAARACVDVMMPKMAQLLVALHQRGIDVLEPDEEGKTIAQRMRADIEIGRASRFPAAMRVAAAAQVSEVEALENALGARRAVGLALAARDAQSAEFRGA